MSASRENEGRGPAHQLSSAYAKVAKDLDPELFTALDRPTAKAAKTTLNILNIATMTVFKLWRRADREPVRGVGSGEPWSQKTPSVGTFVGTMYPSGYHSVAVQASGR